MSWRQKLKTQKAQQTTQELVEEVTVVEKPVEKKVDITPEINNNYNFDPNKTYLVVGGKVKEIGSKSKYLLDMLIIKEED